MMRLRASAALVLVLAVCFTAGSRRRRTAAAITTPILLQGCKKPWTFQDSNGTMINACIKCRPDAPSPVVIANQGKKLVWVCDASKFISKSMCMRSLSWLGKGTTTSGISARLTCRTLRGLVKNEKRAKRFHKLEQNRLEQPTLPSRAKSRVILITSRSFFRSVKGQEGSTRFSRTVHGVVNEIRFAQYDRESVKLFVMASNTMRA